MGMAPQMFLNNDIYAVYPAALVLFLLKYQTVFCLQPLPWALLSSLSRRQLFRVHVSPSQISRNSSLYVKSLLADVCTRVWVYNAE